MLKESNVKAEIIDSQVRKSNRQTIFPIKIPMKPQFKMHFYGEHYISSDCKTGTRLKSLNSLKKNDKEDTQ